MWVLYEPLVEIHNTSYKQEAAECNCNDELKKLFLDGQKSPLGMPTLKKDNVNVRCFCHRLLKISYLTKILKEQQSLKLFDGC